MVNLQIYRPRVPPSRLDALRDLPGGREVTYFLQRNYPVFKYGLIGVGEAIRNSFEDERVRLFCLGAGATGGLILLLGALK